MEMTGIIRHNGCYYVNGHGGAHFSVARNLVTYASLRFRALDAGVLPRVLSGLVCLSWRCRILPSRGTAGEQVHLGAGLWDRGNVILGVYDAWHGPPSGDSDASHDGPGAGHQPRCPSTTANRSPSFGLVPALEEQAGSGTLKPEAGLPPLTLAPSLSHGQGMLNWGDETMLWYEAWVDGGIRLAPLGARPAGLSARVQSRGARVGTARG